MNRYAFMNCSYYVYNVFVEILIMCFKILEKILASVLIIQTYHNRILDSRKFYVVLAS